VGILAFALTAVQTQKHDDYFPLTVGSNWTYIGITGSDHTVTKIYTEVTGDTIINSLRYFVVSDNNGRTKRFYRSRSGNVYRLLDGEEYLCIPSLDSIDKPFRLTVHDTANIVMTLNYCPFPTSTPIAVYDSTVCLTVQNENEKLTTLYYLKRGIGIVCIRDKSGELLAYLDTCNIK
jgi:hypothetical protein